MKSWLIGGASDCDLIVDVKVVSAHHCRLTQASDGFYLEDLGSTNGTFVNGERLAGKFRISLADNVTLGLEIKMPWPEAALRTVAPDTATQQPPTAQKVLTIGRAPTCDLVVDRPSVSDLHARLFVRAENTLLEDLDSTSGTFVDGSKITRALLSKSSSVRLGDYDVPSNLLDKYLPAGPIDSSPEATQYAPHLQPPTDRSATSTLEFSGDAMVLGRDPSCEHVLDHAVISRRHARLTHGKDGIIVEDLGSTNGTYVNGQRIRRPTVLRPGDVVALGSFALELADAGTFQRRDLKGDITLEAQGITVDVPGKRLLEDLSFTILPGELVGLMGPSGSGKSTLMHALNGYTPPTGGQTLINGRDVYQEYDLFRGQIGYVPQDDIIHGDLTVGQALYYTARLRLPRDFSDAEIKKLIQRVLQQLGLQATEHVLIGSPEKKGISGGQRKRVNLAMELLTDPSVLFLDEPTSGLSSEDALMVMKLLRDLANQGKTILITIHQPSLEVFRLMDNLVLVGKDAGSSDPGRLVYYGRAYPDAVWFFNQEDKAAAKPGAEPSPDEVLRGYGQRPAKEWVERYRRSGERRRYVDQRAGNSPARDVRSERVGTPVSTVLRQWWTLTQRCFEIKLKDRANSAILLAQAPIIAVLVAIVFGKQVSEEVTPENWPAVASAVATTVFLLALAALWFGCSNSAREIVGEWAIYRRERMVNLKIPAYVASKLTVLGGLCLLQCGVLIAIVYLGVGLEGPWLKMFVLVLLTSLVGLALGLTVSALARSSEVAIALLPLILIPMVILAGVLQPLHRMSSVAWTLAQVMPSRWAFEGLLYLEVADRPTWTPPSLPALPTTGDLPSSTPAAPQAGEEQVIAGVESKDMAEKFFPSEDGRMGWGSTGLVLFGMLILLVVSIHIILRVRDVH